MKVDELEGNAARMRRRSYGRKIGRKQILWKTWAGWNDNATRSSVKN
jgi:hypothetical protein